ncbi:MAG: DNA-3-methyladenine glycosylase 2 family protein [Betaproteobacteria bacterium]|nr:DNA-3-methyladenine glycosylase 2 family protein [Betaproteobacteria bacterium]
MTPRYWKRAVRELSERDPVMAGIIESHPNGRLRSRGDPFTTLARSIVGQQISVKAADAVWSRFESRVQTVAPESVYAVEAPDLRACGLSGKKAEYLRDLARHFIDGKLEPGRWQGLADETLIAELTRVRGIGRWSAEMFLIFHLLRPDVFPVDDLGLQRALCLHYNRGRRMPVTRMRKFGQRWLPWRSVATWYLWRSLDPVPVEY